MQKSKQHKGVPEVWTKPMTKLFENDRLVTELNEEQKYEEVNEGTNKLVQLIEGKYRKSSMRGYKFPGRDSSRSEVSFSVSSLIEPGPYNLHLQNQRRNRSGSISERGVVYENPSDNGIVRKLDFSRLSKPPKKLSNSRGAHTDRNSTSRIKKSEAGCNTSRGLHRDNGNANNESKKDSQRRAHPPYLKSFLQRAKVGNSKSKMTYPSKLNLMSAFKKSQQGPGSRGNTDRQHVPPQLQQPDKQSTSKPRTSTRKEQLLRYLREGERDIKKLNTVALGTHKTGYSGMFESSKMNKSKNTPVIRKSLFDKPLARLSHSIMQMTLPLKQRPASLSKSKSPVKKSKSCSSKELTKPKPVMNSISSSSKLTKPKKKTKPKSTDLNSRRSDSRGSQKLPKHFPQPSSKYGAKIMAVTKVTINNKNAFLNFSPHSQTLK